MACKYCYTGSARRRSPHFGTLNNRFRANLPLLYRFIDQVLEYNKYGHSTFLFHGGEPLLVNPGNWTVMLNYFRIKEYDVALHVQTNASLINDAFIDLFKEHNVQIGVSLDGPAGFNDKTRIFKDGKGTFSTVFPNIQKTKQAGLPVGCLVTLNSANKTIPTLYTFFKTNNIPFNIRSVFDNKYSVPNDILISTAEYATAICELFDHWFDDLDEPPPIGDFENIVARFIIKRNRLTTCNFVRNCSRSFIGFNMEGYLYPCNCFSGTTYCYGNITKTSIKDIMRGPQIRLLSQRWAKLSASDCEGCEVYSYCYGGCPSRAFDYYGNYFKKDPFCSINKSILNHAYLRIKASLKTDAN
jgi:uncharacterized protein